MGIILQSAAFVHKCSDLLWPVLFVSLVVKFPTLPLQDTFKKVLLSLKSFIWNFILYFKMLHQVTLMSDFLYFKLLISVVICYILLNAFHYVDFIWIVLPGKDLCWSVSCLPLRRNVKIVMNWLELNWTKWWTEVQSSCVAFLVH
jgi:hypothetical protein